MITKQNHTGSYRAIVLAAALVCAGGGLTAAESPAPQEPPKGWETTAAAALTLTRGNSETFLATLSLDTKRKWEKEPAAECLPCRASASVAPRRFPPPPWSLLRGSAQPTIFRHSL